MKIDKDKLKENIKAFPKRVLDFAKSVPGRIKTWFLGTEEHPVPTFGYRARLRRWWLVTFRGYVYFYTTSYDPREQEYRLDKDIWHRSKIPKEAVPVTGWKKSYHYDLDLPKRGFSTVEDYGFTAVSAWLYMKCNKFEDAMRVNLDSGTPVDMKKVLLIAAVVFGIFCGLYFYAGPSL